jgi:hypothetical protein
MQSVVTAQTTDLPVNFPETLQALEILQAPESFQRFMEQAVDSDSLEVASLATEDWGLICETPDQTNSRPVVGTATHTSPNSGASQAIAPSNYIRDIPLELDVPPTEFLLEGSQRQHLLNEIWGNQFGGWAQIGFTGNPDSSLNTPVLFNDRANQLMMNQLALFWHHDVAVDGTSWDVGGRLDLWYGTDSRFVTVPGLERHRDGTRKWNSETERYGLAMPQAYVELAAPVADGLSIKAGHFYSIAGTESIPAPYNFFYSHSYALLYGQPFTHTGALTSYRPNKQITMQLGYTQGWDVWNSEASSYGILGQYAITSLDQQTTLATTIHAGQDVTGVVTDVPLVDDRYLLNVVVAHRISARLQGVIQGDYGYQASGAVIVNPGLGTTSFDSAQWGGVTSYLLYQLSPCWNSALRVEWFNDADQSRLGIPVVFDPGGDTFQGGNYCAVTAGLNYLPHNNLIFRPELRWDWSDLRGNAAVPGGDSSIRAFDNRTSANQITLGADLILSF